MKGLIQRVSSASVNVNGEQISAIDGGLLLLLGVERHDGPAEATDLCKKILTYRVFPDDQDKMNRSLIDTGGCLLVVPQFTLAADTRSGTRPGFSLAAKPEVAEQLYRAFVDAAREQIGAARVSEGRFGADMKVQLTNDGPVTFMLQVGASA